MPERDLNLDARGLRETHPRTQLGAATSPYSWCPLLVLHCVVGALATREGCSSARTVRGVTWKPRAERGHRVRSDATEPQAGSHYVPDGTVHAVDDLTGEVACGFDGELIEIEASWESPAVASLKCASCEQELSSRS